MKKLILAIALFMPSVLIAGSVIQLKSISDQSLKSTDNVEFKKININGGIRFGTDVFASNVAQLYQTATAGTVLTGVAGSTFDLMLAESGGILLFVNPAGTNDVVLNSSLGNTGIKTLTPTHQLDINGGAIVRSSFTATSDIYITTNTAGVILRSPNQTQYRLKVDNAGNLTTESVP